MRLDEYGKTFLIKEEGVKLSSYLDSANIWTIGVGVTTYLDGTKVKKGDVITLEENKVLFEKTVSLYENNITRVVKTILTQNMFNALVSLCYNIGIGAFNNSTLLKEINKNPQNPNIKHYIEQWRYVTVNGDKKPILYNRRVRESNLYFYNG